MMGISPVSNSITPWIKLDKKITAARQGWRYVSTDKQKKDIDKNILELIKEMELNETTFLQWI